MFNLCTGFFQNSNTRPDAPALYVGDRVYSYGQLGAKVRSLARWLTERIAARNARVGILANRSFEAYAGILACAWSGCAYVPLNPKFPLPRLNETLQSADLEGLIVDHSGLELLPRISPEALNCPVACPFPGKAEVPLPEGAEEPGDGSSDSTPVAAHPEDLAYLMFTSGTTGKPKGIAVSIGNVLHFLEAMQTRYKITPQDRLSQFFELTFDLSVFDIFMAFTAGASLHVIPESGLMAPVHFIRDHALTVWFSVPSLVGLLRPTNLLREGCLPGLRLSLFCGEALPLDSAEAWQNAAPNSLVENLYGPTEATVACLAQPYTGASSSTPDRGIVAIGRPLSGVHAAVVDQHRNFLAAGQPGELALSGEQVTPGYWRNPKLTEERYPILSHPELGRTRWYLTGDKAYRDSGGIYHFLGRIDNQIKIRGHRIELEEIEYHLRMVSGCDSVAAAVCEVGNSGMQQIFAAVADRSLDAASIKKGLRQFLPGYMVPQRILLLDRLPRNPSGKIDRKALRSLVS